MAAAVWLGEVLAAEARGSIYYRGIAEFAREQLKFNCGRSVTCELTV